MRGANGLAEKLVAEVISREGGYVNHPSDRGGPTNFGITEQTARANGYMGRMQDLPRGTAESIYTRRYWTQPRLNDVAVLSPKIAAEMFDTGVNSGQSRAARFLQRALNLLNRQGRTYGDIAVDGNTGDLTIHTLGTYLAKAGKDGEATLLKALECQQGEFYMKLAESSSSQEDFLNGWLRTRVGLLG